MKTCFLASLVLIGCSSAPKLEAQHIRPWDDSLKQEYPQEAPVIAHYKKNNYELYYLAAKHSNDIGNGTLNLVEDLFTHDQFNVLLLEPFPYDVGQSPSWFVREAQEGLSEKFIYGGESSLAAILADKKKIPFFGGEPDHRDIYNDLKRKGYSDQDILGFYLVRQIPEWIREKEDKKGLVEHKGPSFLASYCKTFGVKTCPHLGAIKAWYKSHSGHELDSNVLNEEVAPVNNGALFTQKISSDIGYIRDHFTLALIQKLLAKYQKVAVVYGAGHFVTLRKSFDNSFGEPTFTVDATQNFSEE